MAEDRVLVIGAGGREHALAWRLSTSEEVAEVTVTPGNAGCRGDGLVTRDGDPLTLARELTPSLVVVGPEAPLCEGLVDELSAQGSLTYGPSRAAAQLEASKAFMKDFANRHGIPTARHVVVRSMDEVEAALKEFAGVPVVKADGLAAGKGVVVAQSADEVRSAARAMLEEGRFGAAGGTVVLEERLLGAEASIHAISDGERLLVLPPAQDHKRIGDGDTGPNTGGMGTYAPAPLIDAALRQRIEREILEPVVRGMAADGTPFRGTVFAGLMVAPDGNPRLLEINVRFGDPETQVLMSVLDGDLYRLLKSAAQGRLDLAQARVSARHSVCVVLASRGYPAGSSKGDVIEGIDAANALTGVHVFHAGTKLVDEQVVTNGGRVLGVTATADSLAAARKLAYQAADQIRFDGCQLRRDIAARTSLVR